MSVVPGAAGPPGEAIDTEQPVSENIPGSGRLSSGGYRRPAPARAMIELSGDATVAPRDMEDPDERPFRGPGHGRDRSADRCASPSHVIRARPPPACAGTKRPEPLYGGSAARRVTVRDLAAAKARGEKWPMLTAYDALTARVFDEAGIPVLLVGDSAGMVVFGHDTTLPVTVDDLIPLTAAVVRGTRRAMVVADLPFGSYQASRRPRWPPPPGSSRRRGRTRSSWRAASGSPGR